MDSSTRLFTRRYIMSFLFLFYIISIPLHLRKFLSSLTPLRIADLYKVVMIVFVY